MATAPLAIRPPPSAALLPRAVATRPLSSPPPPLAAGSALARGRRLLPRLAAARPLRPDGGTELRVEEVEKKKEDVEERRLEDSVVRTLLIDNYDSYTYNIYQELSVVNGVPPVVIYNDEWTWEFIYDCLYQERAFDNIVISPGPGNPTCPRDVGICLEVLLHCKDIPILGVCLGHQALGYVHGAQIIHAPEPIHGRLSGIEHTGCHLFRNIPSGIDFKVMRYHSLVVDADSLPEELIPIAWATSTDTLPFLGTQNSEMVPDAFLDKQKQHQATGLYHDFLKREELSGINVLDNLNRARVLMAVMHSTRPHYGVQFHPESVATNFGRRIFENFKRVTLDCDLRKSPLHERKVSHACESVEKLSRSNQLREKAMIKQSGIQGDTVLADSGTEVKCLKLQWRKIDSLLGHIGGSENIFCEIFGDCKADDTFWLDSSTVDQNRARFSFMGGKGGSLWKQMTFRLSDQGPEHMSCQFGEERQPAGVGGFLTIRDGRGSFKTTFVKDGFLDFLNKELQSFRYDKQDYDSLPFDFHGGFVGYLGYGLKVECGALFNNHRSKTPEACFFFADNLVVIDHLNGDVYILSLHEQNSENMGEHGNFKESSWLVETEKRLLGLKSLITRKFNMQISRNSTPFADHGAFRSEKSRSRYIMDVEKCLRLIRDGESYELCLTTQMTKRVNLMNYLKLYLTLRTQNPAPYAAWFNFAEEELCICCSSPERFLRLDGNDLLEAKPIKGTIARGRTPEEDEFLRSQLQYSEKDQAENLMIVDLLRNDLGRVCEPGSVHVPRLMEVETYATVHTLVSTIQGKKKSNVSAVECVRASFPGGSMTGAPKLRSMELLDSIESCSRGIYSGSIGFFSYNQAFDLNIVIRTVVIHKEEASVGAGGAVIALSNPEDEYAEMLLKAKAPTRVVEECSKNINLSSRAAS